MGTYIIEQKKVNRRSLLLFVIAFLCVNAFVYFFISGERYIYFWDYCLYWVKYQELGSLFHHAPLKAIVQIWKTVRHDDYNMLPVLFLMPFRLFFGASRLAYELAIANIYVCPSAVLCSALVGEVVSSTDRTYPPAVAAITLSTFLLLPQLWVPVLFGFPDIVGVIVIFLILLILLRRPVQEMTAKSLISVALLLTLLVTLRRWYAYWVVSFFVALAVETAVTLLPQHRFRARNYLTAAGRILIMGAISAAAFFLFATPIALKMVTTDYADIYSAYKRTQGVAPFLMNVARYFGPFLSALFVISLAVGIVQQKTRKLTRLLMFHFLCVIAIFSRVQDFSVQHNYLLIPSVILCISLLMVALWSRLRDISLRSFFLAGYALILTIQFSLMFAPAADALPLSVSRFFSLYRHYPLVRNDLDEMSKLFAFLEKESASEKGGIYVIASSTTISDDIMRNACRAFDRPQPFCDRILPASHVDKRDGFPENFLQANLVVIAAPVQYHLGSEGQRVVGVLAAEMTNQESIGASFEKLPDEFTLDGGVKVFVYKKTKPLSEAGLHDLESRFWAYYPDRKDLFTIRR